MVKKKSSYQSRRKKQVKIVFWILTIALAVGLIGSSVSWSTSGLGAKKSQSAGTQRQQKVDLGQVIKDLEAKAEANPQDTENLEKLAAAYEQDNKRDKALEIYEKIIKIDSDNTEIGLMLVRDYFLLSRYDEAEKQVKNVLKVELNNQDAHYYYGLIMGYGKKDYQTGIAELEKYVELAKTGKDVQLAKDLIEQWQSQTKQ